ncbi:hypothetical protein WJX72_005045 [[Myrmecia] bisecta]|uniref:Peptidase S54 rhomboid domain-containing protein n=1 Tax=[Myrmecia] bisecta TaxID=41462 RepID=A0AAW1QF90_9CHLO
MSLTAVGQPVGAKANDVNDFTNFADLEFDKKYGASNPPKSVPKTPAKKEVSIGNSGNGVFSLLLLNLGVFVASNILQLPRTRLLFLDHAAPRWWQFITCAFCHASWDHISSNLFLLYFFGRIVEEEEGWFGVWGTYLICALGGSLASYYTMPAATMSLGASGAVFGMFAVAVLTKLRFNLKKLLECLILGQFVVKQVLQEVQAQAAISTGKVIAGQQIGHLAHLGGALAGVIIVFMLSRLPAVSDA